MRWTSRLLICLSALAVSLATLPALADEPVIHLDLDDSLPPPSARTHLILLGTGLTLGFYGSAALAAVVWPQDPGAQDLLIPVVGPWLKLGQTTLCKALVAGTTCSEPLQVAGGVFSALDGIAQVGALLVLAQGILMKTGSAADAARPPVGAWWPDRPQLVRIQAFPLVTRSTVGFFVAGTF